MTKRLKPAELYTHTHTHTGSVLLSVFLIFNFNIAMADDTDIASQVQYKEQIIRELRDEIQQIDSEMARCEKAKKGWVAATVVGGVGVAATGTAAIVQTVKANKQKSEKKETETEEKK